MMKHLIITKLGNEIKRAKQLSTKDIFLSLSDILCPNSKAR